MAKIVEEVVVVRFSKLVKDIEANETNLASIEVLTSLEQVAQELVGEGIVVEVVKE